MNPIKHTIIVDASYNHEREVVGIGLIVRATNKPKAKSKRGGPIVSQYSEAYIGISSTDMEEFAILRALEIASSHGYRFVKVRSDYNSMRTKLQKDRKEQRGHNRNDLHGMILRLAKQFEEVQFFYQPRRKNQIAHQLSRFAAKELGPIKRYLTFEEIDDFHHSKVSQDPETIQIC